MNSLTSAGESVGYVIGSVLKGAFDAVTAPIRFVLWGFEQISKLAGDGPPTSFESGMGSGVDMGDYASVQRGPRAINIPHQRFEGDNVGMALQKKAGNNMFDSGLKARPVANRVTTVTNHHKPEFNITMAPGADGKAFANDAYSQWRHLNEGNQGGGLYDY